MKWIVYCLRPAFSGHRLQRPCSPGLAGWFVSSPTAPLPPGSVDRAPFSLAMWIGSSHGAGPWWRANGTRLPKWGLKCPQDSEALDLDNDGVPDPRDDDGGDNGNGGGGGGGGGPVPALPGPIGWGDYLGPDGIPSGLPFIGPVQKWSEWYDAPLHGCGFKD